jgi:hypothetical protein
MQAERDGGEGLDQRHSSPLPCRLKTRVSPFPLLQSKGSCVSLWDAEVEAWEQNEGEGGDREGLWPYI